MLFELIVLLIVLFLILVYIRRLWLQALVVSATVNASICLLTFRVVRSLELRSLHLRKFRLRIHSFMTHLLMHLSHLTALHVCHLRKEIDLLLHFGNLGILVGIAHCMRTHLLHRKLHTHWHHLGSHLRILHRVLWHHWVLHKLLLMVLPLDLLHLLALSLIHAWIMITA